MLFTRHSLKCCGVFSRWRCLWMTRRNWPFTVCSSTTANWRTARRTANSSTCSTSWSSTRWALDLMLIPVFTFIHLADASDQTRPRLLQSCCDSSLFPKEVCFLWCPSKCIGFPSETLPASCRLWFLSEVLETVLEGDSVFVLQVVIFVKSVQRCVALSQLLVEQNFPAIAIHRGMAQEERCVCALIHCGYWRMKPDIPKCLSAQTSLKVDILTSKCINYKKIVVYNIINLSNFSCSLIFVGYNILYLFN